MFHSISQKMIYLTLACGFAAVSQPIVAVEIVEVEKAKILVGTFDRSIDLQIEIHEPLTLKPKGFMGGGTNWVTSVHNLTNYRQGRGNEAGEISPSGRIRNMPRATILGRDYALLSILLKARIERTEMASPTVRAKRSDTSPLMWSPPKS